MKITNDILNAVLFFKPLSKYNILYFIDPINITDKVFEV